MELNTNSPEEARIETLEKLVDELMKEVPEESLIKSYMEQSGLQYSKDPIGRINIVLKALHFEEPSESQ
ncbi:MAG: hypothetical protein KDD61_12875 [Bdellovibrionales bacterium]|nr:hypothetical protein [Bdellovibrionales bacterium]